MGSGPITEGEFDPYPHKLTHTHTHTYTHISPPNESVTVEAVKLEIYPTLYLSIVVRSVPPTLFVPITEGEVDPYQHTFMHTHTSPANESVTVHLSTLPNPTH